LLTVSTPDKVTLSANFDRPLDPLAPLTPESFRVVSTDSTPLRIVAVRTQAQEAARRAGEDTAARRDSTARPDSSRADTARARRQLAAMRPPGPSQTSQLKPSRPAPARDVTIHLDSLTPMRPGGSYLVTAINARGLLGQTRTSDRVITFSTARADTTARRRVVPPPAPPVSPRPPVRPP
jgi:hypothetical protein